MTEESIRGELDALQADLAKLREDVSALTEAVRAAAQRRVDDARGEARQRAEGAWEDLERRLEEMRTQGEETLQRATREVAEHPAASLLAAFGVGFVLARLLDGGRR